MTFRPNRPRTGSHPDLLGHDPLTAMLVDDAEEFRLLLGVALRQLGVVTTPVAHEQLVFSTLLETNPHVLVLDVHMPGLDGPRLCRMIRKLPQGRALPIILCSASPALDVLARECGASGTVSKAQPVTDVAAAIVAHAVQGRELARNAR